MQDFATPAPSDGTFPLSHAQRAIWLDEQLRAGGRQNHISLVVRMLAGIDHAAFGRAAQRVVDAHPALRTRFHQVAGERDDATGRSAVVGDPVQTPVPEIDARLAFVDATTWSDADVDERLRDEHLRAFDLEHGEVVRFVVLERGPRLALLAITIHHLVADLWSIAVLGDQLTSFYRTELGGGVGAGSGPGERRRRRRDATYRDYVDAEREYLAGPEAAMAGAHWAGLLADRSSPGLVTDHRRPADAIGDTAIREVELGERHRQAIRAAASRTEVTERSIVLAAYLALVDRHSTSDQVTVAELKAVRTARTAHVVGCCVNWVPRVAACSDDTTFAALLDAVESQTRASVRHDRYPFDLIVRAATPRRTDEAFFDAAFAWQKTTRLMSPALVSALAIGSAEGAATLSGLDVEAYPLRTRSSPFALSLLGVEDHAPPHGLRLAFEYQTERFDAATVDQLADRLLLLLDAMTADPAQRIADVDLLTDAERAARRAEWDAVATPVAPIAVHRLVEERVAAAPDAVAVRSGGRTLTYRELDERANQLAHHLIDLGVERGRLVGIALDRSTDMVASMLAVWKCGTGYVPMDPDFPAERLEIMTADADVGVVITTDDLASSLGTGAATRLLLDRDAALIDGRPCDAPAVEVSGDDVAYTIFTSGSTGRPKGVVVEHGNVVNFVSAMARRPGITADDVVLASTTLSFDISVLEILLPLTVGATVRVVDRATLADPVLLSAAIERVTVAQGTPTMWNMLVMSGWQPSQELTVLCGGEPLSRSLADALLARSRNVWNMYGPTETTIWSAVGPVTTGIGPVSIGEPIDNTRLYVLERGHLLPDGVAGELWIGGAGVARGYVGRPDLTAERFAPDPFWRGDPARPAERMYRTGDLVRRRTDGGIEFLGRVDDQIKLRGHRIELGEIEAALDTHPAVAQSVVTVRSFGADDDRLVAYYEPRRIAPRRDLPSAVELREHLRATLPDYMRPAHYVLLERFPRTPNDKVDRRRLPAPTTERTGDPTPDLASLGEPTLDQPTHDQPTLEMVVNTYRDILRDDSLEPNDDFFEHGGHSLLATRIASRLRRDLQRSIAIRAVLDHPTPADLARHIATLPPVDDAGPDLTGADPGDGADGDGTYLPSWSQERMWFMHELHPDGAAYNLAAALEVRGALDIVAFHGAWNRLVQRHTALRSSFVTVGGVPRLRVREPFTISVERFDHRSAAGADVPAVRIDPVLRELATRPFDLARAPLFRVSSHRLGADHHVVGLVMHHAVSDQWSFGILLREFGEIYEALHRGADPDLPPPPHPERFAEWQRRQVDAVQLDALRDHWRARLHDLPTIELPADHERPPTPSTRGATVVRPLPPSLGEAVRAAATSERATEFMVYLAALDVLIADRTGAGDVVVGVPIANRHWLDSENMITSLVNTLVLRTDLSGAATYRDVVRRVRQVALDAYAHQDMPFEQLVHELAPRRELGRSPLFQVFLNVQNAPLELPVLDGLDLTVRPIDRGAAQHDVALTIDTSLTGLLTLEYATDLFDAARMERLLDDYLAIVTAATTGGDGLDSALPVDVAATARDAVARRSVGGAPAESGARAEARSPGDRSDEAPRPGLESELASIWESALGESDLRRGDDFFEMGGHSLLAIRMLSDVEALVGTRPPVSALFGAPSLASFAETVETRGWATRWTSLVEVQRGADRRPYFYVSPFLITALSMKELATHMGHDVPFYALQPQGIETDDPVHQSIEEMATHYIAEMRTVQPTGPYLVGGHCAGAWVAFEITRQLQRAGEQVGALIVVDVEPPGIDPPPPRPLRRLWSRIRLYAGTGRLIHSLHWQARLRVEHLRTRSARRDGDRANLVETVHRQAHRQYRGGTIEGDMTFIRSEEWAKLADKSWHRQWSTLVDGTMTEIVVPGAHSELLVGDGVRALSERTRRILDASG